MGCRGVCSLCQHAAQHGHGVMAAQGGETAASPAWDIAVPPCLTQEMQGVRTERDESSHAWVCIPISSVTTSIPPAQVLLSRQAAPGRSRSPLRTAHPTWRAIGDIKAAAEPSPHPGGKFPHRHPQVATGWGFAEGWEPAPFLPAPRPGSAPAGLPARQPSALRWQGGLQPKSSFACRSSSFIPACSPAPSPVFTPIPLTSPWGQVKPSQAREDQHHLLQGASEPLLGPHGSKLCLLGHF